MTRKIAQVLSIRRGIHELIAANEKEFAKHRRLYGKCMSSCDEANRYYGRAEAFEAALKVAGGRI